MLTIAALLGTAASCDRGPVTTVVEVTRASVVEIVDAPAQVTARAAVTVSAPANGTLAAVKVTPGDSVTAGQVLAVVDSPEAQARLKQAEQALAAANQGAPGGGSVNLGGVQRRLDEAAERAFAEARDAAEQLPDPEHRDAALEKIDKAEQAYGETSALAWETINGVQRGIASISSAMRALGTAQQMQARQAYDLAKATVDALMLRAPIDGIVQLGGAPGSSASAPDLAGLLGGLGGLDTTAAGSGGPLPGVTSVIPVGTPVSTGTAILTVVDVSELGLVAEVDETDILLVQPGVEGEAELDAAPGIPYAALVTAVDLLPTPNSRGAVAYQVHVSLAASSGPPPRPGMSAVLRLWVREASNTIAVPAAAVFTRDGHDNVWVRADDGTATARRVVIGVAGRDLLEITHGLDVGEQIVVSGVAEVDEGDRL